MGGGAGTNRTGMGIETLLQSTLAIAGFDIKKWGKAAPQVKKLSPQKRVELLQDAARVNKTRTAWIGFQYEGWLAGDYSRADAFLFDETGKSTHIEMKNQAGPGSAENKLTHAFIDLAFYSPATKPVIVYSGDGWKETSTAFLKRISTPGGYPTKTWGNRPANEKFTTMDLNKFISYLQKTYVLKG